jgi:outer membrane protein
MKLQAPLALLLALAAPLTATNEIFAADLGEIYRLARDRDSVIQATQAQFEAAQQALPIARAGLLPSVTLQGDKALNETNDDAQGRFDSDAYGATITQTIFNRSTSQTVAKARLSVAQAEASLREAEQSLIFRTAQAYFNVLTAEEAFRAASSSRDAISRQTEQAEKRFEVGLTAITDVKEAQAQLDLAVAREVVAENQVALAKQALRVITGQEVPDLDPLSQTAKLTAPVPQSLDQWLALAEANSPRLKIANFDYEIARADIKIERGARLPTLALNGRYTNSTTEATSSRPEIESGQLQLQLTYPIITGGRTNALIRQARARSRQAAFNQETVRRAVEQETRDAYLSVLADISQARALKQALSSTEVAKDATQAGFDAGTRTAVEVLVSLRDTFNAYADFAAARHQYVVRSLQLRQAAGILAEKHIEAVNSSLEPRN